MASVAGRRGNRRIDEGSPFALTRGTSRHYNFTHNKAVGKDTLARKLAKSCSQARGIYDLGGTTGQTLLLLPVMLTLPRRIQTYRFSH
jgi:hypothetical protein